MSAATPQEGILILLKISIALRFEPYRRSGKLGSFRPNPSIFANFRRQSKVFKLYQAPSTLINHPPFLSGSTDLLEAGFGITRVCHFIF